MNTYRTRPGLVIVRVEDGDRDGSAGGERHVLPGNVVDGVVAEVDGQVSVIGGEDDSIYANGILPGADGIFIGAGTIQGVYTYPTATIEAWKSFSASIHASATPSLTSAKLSARFKVPT